LTESVWCPSPAIHGGEAKKLFAASEVALHASRKDCWVVIGGKASEKEIFLAVLLLVLWGTKREI